MVEGETTMREGAMRSSRYSPGNMDRQSLETLFVGRDDLMEDVLARVTKSVLGKGKHYVLLVGPRGSGKTHFLALARHRLMDRFAAANAQSKVVVAPLKEEEGGVASFLDFVVRILRAIADQVPGLEAEIAATYEKFPKEAPEAEAFALTRLRHRTKGKTLLLVCENLVDLFDGLGDEGQKRWRAAIQEHGNWAILASTPSLFAAVTLQNKPFHGFFTVRALERIDFEASLDLLTKKAIHERKTDLADFLRTPLGHARARAVHHLASGNHRAYVVLFDFLNRDTLDDLVGPFMRMVDDLTPYYQDRMRRLPPAQRKIAEFLCLGGKPKTIKDIATPCLMSQQTAAKQIGELHTAGFVRRTRVGRNTFCEIADPLMRICVELKNNKTQHFRLFVEFLRYWFQLGDDPRHLHRGTATLRELLTSRPDDGVFGRTLTELLKANIDDGFEGDLADWELALQSVAASLNDLLAWRIPFEMLQVAVRYAKTGDERHLLSLPLEQRQLLEDRLSPTAGASAEQ